MTSEDLDDSHIILKKMAMEIQEDIKNILVVATEEKGEGDESCKLKELFKTAPAKILDKLYEMELDKEKTEFYEELICNFFNRIADCLEISQETREYFWNKAKAQRYFK